MEFNLSVAIQLVYCTQPTRLTLFIIFVFNSNGSIEIVFLLNKEKLKENNLFIIVLRGWLAVVSQAFVCVQTVTHLVLTHSHTYRERERERERERGERERVTDRDRDRERIIKHSSQHPNFFRWHRIYHAVYSLERYLGNAVT